MIAAEVPAGTSRLRRAKERVLDPQFVLKAFFLILLSYLILYPLLELIWSTLVWTDRGIRVYRAENAEPGALTGFFWRETFLGLNADRFLYQPLINSLVTGGTAAVLAVLIGCTLAWLVTRTDLPGRHWLKPLLTLPYIVPSFAVALSWETLFKSPRYGGTPGLWEAVFGVEPAAWVTLGPFPIIVTLAIHYSPFAFLLAAGALASVNSEMEESASLLGASRFKVLWRITMPAVAPALLAAAILTFAKAVGTFAMPYLLGVPAQYHTIATRLYSSLALGFEALAYVLALVLIVITGTALFLSTRALGRNMRRFQTIGGKGFRAKPIELGRARWPLFGVVATFTFLTGLFPLGLLAYQTLMKVDGHYGLDNLTLHYWIGTSDPEFADGEPGLIHNPLILDATWNTLQLATMASVTAAVVGLVIGYLIVRNPGKWSSKLLEQLSFMPFLFPGLALAAMYLTLFAVPRGPIPALYGTFILLILICVIDRLPYGVRMGVSSVAQIGTELEEAAELQGASWLKRFRRIILPLAVPGVVSAVMVCFVGLMRELSLFILLITPSTHVLMTLGLQYTEQDLRQLSNAIVLVVAVLTILGELVVWRVGRSRVGRSGTGSAH